MSFRAPRRKSPNKRSSATPTRATPFGLTPTDTVTPLRKPHGTADIVFLPQRDVYAPGGAFAQPFVSQTALPQPAGDSAGPHNISFAPVHAQATVESSHGQKKERQWIKWASVTIPALLEPYLSLLRQTDSLREEITPEVQSHCKCSSSTRKIQVACVYFERKNLINYFPCTKSL